MALVTWSEAVTLRGHGLLRRIGLPLVLLLGSGLFVSEVHGHYSIQQWLFWRYLACWLLTLCWGAACASAGVAVVRQILPRLPARERLVGGLASGLLIFFIGMFLGGLLHLYGPVFFVAWPLLMLAASVRWSHRFFRRYPRRWLALRCRGSVSPWTVLVLLFGLGGLAMVYFNILTPNNVAADSHWYHLPIAEHYSARRGVGPFVEGWYQGALPHLASFVYTWAFMLPAGTLFDRVELAAHLEFMIFLWTLLSMPVLIRWALAPGVSMLNLRARARGATQLSPNVAASWAAIFLFPGIFLYDSSLSVAADHVGAFWAVPLLLASIRMARTPSWRHGIWLAVPAAGAVLTKYQSVSLLGFPVLAVLARTTWLVCFPRGGASRWRPLAAAATAGAACLVLTAPHWLKNWVYYGDPFYPFLHHYLAVHPWTVDSGNLFDNVFRGQLWVPQGTTWDKLVETLEALFTFSFRPNDWGGFHGKVPVFGSLFTLSLLPLILLRKTGRVWLIAGAVHLGVFTWYWTSHQDRYLQLLVPWMAAVVAVTLRMVWDSGLVARMAVSLLISVQVIWGGDVYFIPTHAMVRSPQKAVIDLLSSGYRKDFTSRENPYGDYGKLGRMLPEGAKVLMHDRHQLLGLEAMAVSDCAPWQGGISYGRMQSAREVYDKLREYGVTHVLWLDQASTGYDSLAGDFVFFAFAAKYLRPHKVGSFRLAAMPADPPPDTNWYDQPAAFIGCSGGYAPGLYRLRDLVVPSVGRQSFPQPYRPLRDPSEARASMSNVQFVAWQPHCQPSFPNPEHLGFRKMAVRRGVQLFVR